jgi:hypothetical protein
MTTHDKNISTNPDMPAQQQLAFLRQHIVNFKLDVFEELEESLGGHGTEIFKKILGRGCKRVNHMTQGIDFQTMAGFAGMSDRMFGLITELDYIKPDEFQYSITYCPFLEESKARGLDNAFCHALEEVTTEAVTRELGEFTEPARMCDGDGKCTFRMRNTLAR